MPRGERIEVEVGDLRPEDVPAAVGVLARGMRDNPIHLAVFAADPARRETQLARLFGATFRVLGSENALCARRDGEILGVTGDAHDRACRPGFAAQMRFLPTVLSLGPRTAARAGRWIGEWQKRDPDEPHSHLGPLGVDSHLQGRGIGSAILAEYTRRLDERSLLGYLETDKRENVVLYERHGFEVVEEAPVLGVPNWFMRRPPR